MKRQSGEIELPQKISTKNRNLMLMKELTDPYLGYMIRGYRLEELLGRGKVTSLYLARTEELWQIPEVIMTLLHVSETFSLQAREKFLERFSLEAKRIAQLRHPSLFPLFGYGQEEGLPYLVMPVVSGVSLAAYFKWQKRWSPSEILAILEPIATALTYIHSQGLVYQFFNPANILLRKDAPPQITGLCLPQILGLTSLAQETVDTSSSHHLRDIAGDYLGVAEYLAPEVVRGEKADARSDVYSLGVILFEMLSGKPPFIGQNYLEVAQKHLQEPLPALHEIVPDLPAALELVIKRALHRNPEQRFQTPDELIAAYSYALDRPLDALKQVHSSSAELLPSPPKSILNAGQMHNRPLTSNSVLRKQDHSSSTNQSIQVRPLPGSPKRLRDVSQTHRGETDSGTEYRDVAVRPVTTGGLITNLLRYMLSNLPLPVQSLIIAILNRASDPEPEKPSISTQQATAPSAMALGWLPMVALTSALGLLVTSFAFNSSRMNGTGLNTFLFLGLPLMLVPTIIRLISPVPSRFERIGMLCILDICYDIVHVMTSPLTFAKYDEFLHFRTVEDIYKTGHLFTKHVLLPVSPYYPGLEIVTNAFSTLSGLDIFYSGLIVIGIAHLVMILSLFIINEQIAKSLRIASIATMIYMANRQFLLFDSLFIYEAFALPLAAFLLFAIGPHQLIPIRLKHPKPAVSSTLISVRRCKDMTNSLQWISLTAWLILGAVAVTHHVTSFFLDGLLLSWAVMDVVVYGTPLLRSKQAMTATVALMISVANIMHPGNPVINYLFAEVREAFNQLERVLAGRSVPRQLFVTYTGHTIPMWERMLGISSVALIVLCIPFGLLCLWLHYRSNTLAVTFGVISSFYLASQVLLFTNAGAGLAERADAFLFIPIAFVLAVFISQFCPVRYLGWKQIVVVTCILLIIFIGGVILGAGSSLSELPPGPYEVSSDARSIEPEGIQAAVWAHSYLKPGNRVVTDHINQLLMNTYGDQNVVTLANDEIDMAPIFFSPHLGSNEIALLRQIQARYLVVDLRVSRSLPSYGYYYDELEEGTMRHTTPVDVKALTKFNTMPQVNKVFDSGDIIIYDVGGLLNAPQKP